MAIKKYIPSASLALGGLAAGAYGGYLFAKKKFRKLADAEIESVKETYRKINKTGEFATPESAVEALISEQENITADILEDNGYNQPKSTVVLEGAPTVKLPNVGREAGDIPYSSISTIQNDLQKAEEDAKEAINGQLPTPEATNIWDKDEPQSAETAIFVSQPNPEKPYVVTIDEFMDGYEDLQHVNVTYYEADDTLTDEADNIIADVEGTVSSDALALFGTGSKDNDIVYVCNEALEAKYEVVRNRRSYQEVVAGIRPENVQLKKMRGDE